MVMVDPISAGVLGKSIWWVCDHASGGALSTFQQAALERMRFPRQARSNHDLQKALQDAFPIAIESMVRSSSEDQQTYLAQIRDRGTALLGSLHSDFPSRLLDALLYEETGSEVWRELWAPLEDGLDARETRPFFKASRLTFERRLQESFANVLRTDKHRRAVVAYQQAMLGEVVSALRDNSRALPEQIATIEALQSVPDLINQATATVLAALQARDQQDLQHQDQLASQLNVMVNSLQSIRDQLVGRFILPNGEVLSTHLRVTCERVRSNLTRRRLVGREEDLQRLSDGLGESKYVAVTGVAGAGKSSLLAHWIDRLSEEDNSTRVCSHFFNRTRDTDRLGGGMACIAEQLLAIHRVSAHVSEAQPERLKIIVSTLLAMQHTQPLVVVLDGLDEITDPETSGRFALGPSWFPETLGKNVHVMLGVRFGPGLEDIDALRDKLGLPGIIPFKLDNLKLSAVRELLVEPRKSLAESIHERTDGLATYVVAVVDAVNRAASDELAIAQLGRLPEKFSDYVNDGLDDATSNHREWLDPLGFLAVASGPLTKHELLRLCATSRNQLVERDLRRPPWEIARWLTEANDTWSFQHVAITEARRVGMAVELGSFRERLLDDCADWEKHKGSYSLIHYPDDLLDMVLDGTSVDSAYIDLQALALNPEYRELQRKLVLQRPALPLQTIQAAMRANRNPVDIVQLTKLMLLHLHLIFTHRVESLLGIAASGHYERAMWLASLDGPHQAAVSYLLIGWREAESGHPERLDAAIARIASLPSVKLNGWLATSITVIATAASVNSSSHAFSCCCSLLNALSLIDLSQCLATSGQYDLALEVAAAITDPVMIDGIQSNLAQILTSNDQLDEARSIVGTISTAEEQSWALLSIARQLIVRGRFENVLTVLDEAVTVVTASNLDVIRVNTLARIAQCLAAINQIEAAKTLLVEAQNAAATITDPDEISWALAGIAQGFASINEHHEARALLNDARDAVAGITTFGGQIGAAHGIAEGFVAINDLDEARSVIADLDEKGGQPTALVAAVKNLVDKGLLDNAMALLAMFPDIEDRSEALTSIAQGFANRGQPSTRHARRGN